MLKRNIGNNQPVRKRSKLISLLYLARVFESSLIAVTGSIELVMLGEKNLERLAIMILGAFFMMTGIYAWNDVLDIGEDTVSHPERPIPRKEITIHEAKIIGTVSLLISLTFFLFLGFEYIILSALGAFVGIAYSRTTKQITFGKTLTVLFTAIVGAFSVAYVERREIPVTIIAFSFSIVLLLLGYEIMKDMRDVRGDAEVGIRTIPMILGAEKATILAGSAFVVSCLGIGAFFLQIGLNFEGVISFITGIIIIPSFVWLYQKPSERTIDVVRLFAIGAIGLSLNAVAVSIYFRSAL
ncbi:MAG: hypothetical protein D6732_23920 [Methanobacteriota archaeon]|nr:MAG: hypothetical protein D6732_23920 [Euryarchaeota archaeon]